jgi:hypothetical protein
MYILTRQIPMPLNIARLDNITVDMVTLRLGYKDQCNPNNNQFVLGYIGPFAFGGQGPVRRTGRCGGVGGACSGSRLAVTERP